jgi:hypothetical protein
MVSQAVRGMLVAAALLLVGVACTSNPLKETAPVQVPQGLTQEQVAEAVKATLLGRGWAINSQRPGVINSTLYIREHTATINAIYDTEQVQFKYVDSTNLDYSESNGERQIHRNYNSWIDNLVNDLRVKLSGIAFS